MSPGPTPPARPHHSQPEGPAHNVFLKKKKKRKLFKADLNCNAYWHKKILLWEVKKDGRKEGRGEGRWDGGPPTVKTLVVRGVI